MPAPSWFIALLLLCNLGATVAFAAQRDWPWALIYAGAAMIQAGSWMLTR